MLSLIQVEGVQKGWCGSISRLFIIHSYSCAAKAKFLQIQVNEAQHGSMFKSERAMDPYFTKVKYTFSIAPLFSYYFFFTGGSIWAWLYLSLYSANPLYLILCLNKPGVSQRMSMAPLTENVIVKYFLLIDFLMCCISSSVGVFFLKKKYCLSCWM